MSRERRRGGLPADLVASARHAVARIERGDYVVGVELLRSLYDVHSEAELEGAVAEVGSALVADTDPDRWVLVAGSPSLGDSLYNLGTILWESETAKGAAHSVFDLALLYGSDDAGSALGVVFVAEGNPDEAVPFLKRSVERKDAVWRQSAGMLGEIYLDGGAIDVDVEQLLEAAIVEFPEYRVPLARLCIARGELDRAADFLEEAMSASEYGAAILLGNILAERGDVAGAVAAYRKGIAEGDGYSAYNLHLLFVEAGELDAAEEALRLARSMGDTTNPAAEEDLRRYIEAPQV